MISFGKNLNSDPNTHKTLTINRKQKWPRLCKSTDSPANRMREEEKLQKQLSTFLKHLYQLNLRQWVYPEFPHKHSRSVYVGEGISGQWESSMTSCFSD